MLRTFTFVSAVFCLMLLAATAFSQERIDTELNEYTIGYSVDGKEAEYSWKKVSFDGKQDPLLDFLCPRVTSDEALQKIVSEKIKKPASSITITFRRTYEWEIDGTTFEMIVKGKLVKYTLYNFGNVVLSWDQDLDTFWKGPRAALKDAQKLASTVAAFNKKAIIFLEKESLEADEENQANIKAVTDTLKRGIVAVSVVAIDGPEECSFCAEEGNVMSEKGYITADSDMIAETKSFFFNVANTVYDGKYKNFKFGQGLMIYIGNAVFFGAEAVNSQTGEKEEVLFKQEPKN